MTARVVIGSETVVRVSALQPAEVIQAHMARWRLLRRRRHGASSYKGVRPDQVVPGGMGAAQAVAPALAELR